jgi:SWI/SNF-related matrix-associated actin-dependent regulator 1 of chromatin subfamily A
MTLPLFQYQADAADVMASRDRLGLHDEMGIGKTATSIGAINRILGTRGMIIGPAMLRQNWMNEWRKFSTYDLRVCKGVNIHDFIAWRRKKFDVIITSYEMATAWHSDVNDMGEFLDFVVIDEAHYLKNENSKRTRAILGAEANGMNCITSWAEHAYHLTGTPASNDPLDYYTFLQFSKAIDMSSAEFTKTFFIKRVTTFGARHTIRPEMLSTLQALLANNSIRRTHKDVGLQLPEIWLKETSIEGSTVEITEAISGYPHLEELIVYAIETGDMSALDAAHIATVRRLVGKAKAVPYAKMLKDELDFGAGKRVVFCAHTEPLLYLRNYLLKANYDCVAVYGESSERERIAAVERFMQDPACKVFIGNIRVAGVGLTLTESCEIDMLESSWTPADNAQAIKRVHRYGQRQTVHARFITLANSLDEVVNQTVARKTAAIAEIEGFQMAAAPLDVLERAR